MRAPIVWMATPSVPEPATLQWRFYGTNVLEATNQCIFLYPLQTGDAGDYSVVATTATSGARVARPKAWTTGTPAA